MIDTHCHLDDAKFSADLPEVVARAAEQGVQIMITVAASLGEIDKVIEISKTYPQVFATIGVHPEVVHEPENAEISTDLLVRLAARPKVVAIGETGLDYYHGESKDLLQEQVFRMHIEAARRTGLPLVIHARNADSDCDRIVRQEYAAAPFRAVIHCFSGGNTLTALARDLDFYVSVGGIATFDKTGIIAESLQNISLERILLETDAPWLAPVPERGHRNEPALMRHSARKIADIKGVSFESLDQTTTQNARRLFGLSQ
ncbi:TatD-related deoxyribonuclease [Alphaproteobacteria bacterium]|nr:TatD-related deoxyribonuclease [Alphaproteobacteria bacterium]